VRPRRFSVVKVVRVNPSVMATARRLARRRPTDPVPDRPGSAAGADPSASARFLSRAVAPVSGWSIIEALLQTAAGLPVTIEHWAVSTVRLAAW
jgi:hypothetical protein